MTNYSDYRTSTLRTLFQSANYTAKANENIWVDSSTIAITITLPLSPQVGASVRVGDASQNAAINNITIARNGETINGLAEDFVVDENNGVVDFVYNGTTWAINVPMVGTGGLTQAQVDARVVTVGDDSLYSSSLITPALLQDDEVWEIDFGGSTLGTLMINTNDSAEYAVIAYRANSSSAFCSKVTGSSNIEVTTGVLSGTTGSDAVITVSTHTDEKMYIENRRGAQRNVYLNIGHFGVLSTDIGSTIP